MKTRKPKMIYLGWKIGVDDFSTKRIKFRTWLGYDKEKKKAMIIQLDDGKYYPKWSGQHCWLHSYVGKVGDLKKLHEKYGSFPKCKKSTKVLKV